MKHEPHYRASARHGRLLHGDLPPLRPRAALNVFRLPRLARAHGRDVAFGGFAFASSLVSMALIAGVASWVRQPLVFPSLGPTAFLIFDHPRAEAAAPRNAILGHGLGLAFGYAMLAAFGLRHGRPAFAGALSHERVAAVALSLALTAGAMALFRVPHPPAAATTLIVSLGLVSRPEELGALMAGVVILLAQGMLLDRLAGLAYPLWHPARRETAATRERSAR